MRMYGAESCARATGGAERVVIVDETRLSSTAERSALILSLFRFTRSLPAPSPSTTDQNIPSHPPVSAAMTVDQDAAQSPAGPVAVEDVDGYHRVLERYTTFLFDMDGVIWTGPAGDKLYAHVFSSLLFDTYSFPRSQDS